MKLKNEPYRCGECKLETRTLLRDDEGNYLKDSLGNYVYDTFTADTHEQMLAHLEISHGLNADKNDDWGQCFDCFYSYSFDNLPIGYDSAGGLLLWCYDCSQKRCLGYGELRSSLDRMLEYYKLIPIRKNKLIKKIKELLSS